MFLYCDKHDMPHTFSVSKRIAELIDRRESIQTKDIKKIYIDSVENSSEIWIDNDMFEKYFPNVTENKVILKDRHKHLHEMNDRLLIKEIDREIFSVCRKCLLECLCDE
ncbi:MULTISPECIES: hypothetical protein [Photorhabdus]|uniref:hypothetical protein n=1 Tax=Photorhabdus TaxID=29487 RepID=UPI00058AFCA2|nr:MULTISPECIES: hypothetical protein [Photorhabdus]MBS9426371.1 hypothetical protein [Photorhabdus caribbeanensis]MBS9430964.1 hypothetical protein [Photorhabdus akhurstii]PQQ35866.1 hypothetical protein C6H65_23575 [Photorhabdus luminescens]